MRAAPSMFRILSSPASPDLAVYFFYIGLALIPFFNPTTLLRGGMRQRFSSKPELEHNRLGLAIHSIVVRFGRCRSRSSSIYYGRQLFERFLASHRLVGFAMLAISSLVRVTMVALHGGVNSVWCNTLARLDPIAAGILMAALLKGRIPNFSLATRLAMICLGIVPLALVANFWHIHEPKGWSGFRRCRVSCSSPELPVDRGCIARHSATDAALSALPGENFIRPLRLPRARKCSFQ